MQSKTSFLNMALFKKNISRTWIAGLLYFVLLLLMLPVFFVINTANINEDDLDFGYCTDDGDRILVGGIWNKDEEQYLKTKGTLVLGENIKRVVYGEIKSNE